MTASNQASYPRSFLPSSSSKAMIRSFERPSTAPTRFSRPSTGSSGKSSNYHRGDRRIAQATSPLRLVSFLLLTFFLSRPLWPRSIVDGTKNYRSVLLCTICQNLPDLDPTRTKLKLRAKIEDVLLHPYRHGTTSASVVKLAKSR